MKNLTLLAFIFTILFGNLLLSQTTLSPGDICIIGIKTNNNTDSGNDAVKLLTLVNLECNTKFVLTDNNWDNSISDWACSLDEFGIEITVNSPITAGSIIYIDVDASSGTASSSTGTLTKTNLGGNWGTNYGLNSGGDNIFVLQGARTSPTFIFGIKHNGAFAIADCSTGGTPKNNTSLPAGLSLGTSALVMASSQDQWHYNCSTNNNSKANIKSAISNNTNWVSVSGQSWNTQTCVFKVTDANFNASGTLAVSGAGCGCLANCDLRQWGSVNCGASGIGGNCTAGYQNMSTSITVPSGCTYTVSAAMKVRGSICSAAGADGNCATCDVLKVDISGGSKSFQQGGSNASLSDSYTLTGPGSIVVSGKADRADEIITYTISIPCACLTLLPIELGEFTVVKDGENAKLEWNTITERDNTYFTLEKSQDAVNWEVLYNINGQGNSSSPYYYTVIDTSPFKGITYYKLSQTDFNGKSTENGIRVIDFKEKEVKVLSEYNVLGQTISSNEKGLIIQVLENGETRKIYRD